ncbi:class V lanthionine synthetase subunit LxmK [Streptomyces himalayensis]|nr:class V lanthionine synthetase subunit LxmK [Streptomyces himalayensis]
MESDDFVAAALAELGLGTFEPLGGETFSGRNDSRTGLTSRGHAVFVKRLTGAEAARRLRTLIGFEQTCRARISPALRTPACLGWDVERQVIVFDWLKDAVSGHDLAADDAFTDDMARRCGAAVGVLHGPPGAVEPPPAAVRASASAVPDLFTALPLDYYERASGAVLAMWRILHGDATIAASLRALRADSRRARPVLIHADLRLDQFLFDADGPLLCDWEEWQMGDPACDVGAFAGEWLYRMLRGIPSDDPREEQDDASPEARHRAAHHRILERGLAGVEAARTKIAAFRDGYADSGGCLSDDLVTRATAYGGWHLLERVLAAAESRPVLGTLDRMLIGIGSTALRTPHKFAQSLGLEGTR